MTVSVLGLGVMGARMAQKLLDAGHAVTVWNRTPRALEGAATAGSPQDAAARDDTSRSVWADALLGVTSGTLVLETGTLAPDRVREQGAAVLEAERSGFGDLDIAAVAGYVASR